MSYTVAVAVGFIALAGVAAEIGVLVLTFVNQEIARQRQAKIEAARAVQDLAEDEDQQMNAATPLPPSSAILAGRRLNGYLSFYRPGNAVVFNVTMNQ